MAVWTYTHTRAFRVNLFIYLEFCFLFGPKIAMNDQVTSSDETTTEESPEKDKNTDKDGWFVQIYFYDYFVQQFSFVLYIFNIIH